MRIKWELAPHYCDIWYINWAWSTKNKYLYRRIDLEDGAVWCWVNRLTSVRPDFNEVDFRRKRNGSSQAG